MPGFPMPASGGAPERAPGGSAKSSMPGKPAYGGQQGGQVTISGPEEKALRVLELDDPTDPNDDAQLIQQAAQESGMTPDLVMKLKARAEAARSKGMTLKGPSITLPPLGGPAMNGLVDDAAGGLGAGGPVPPNAAPPNIGAGAAGAPRMAGGAPTGGPLTSGATMASAGLGTQRYAAPWRPQMSQATQAPPRMTPDVNTAKPVDAGMGGRAGAPGAATKPSYTPAAAPKAPQRPLSRASFGRADARDPKLAAAYAREAKAAVEECSCGNPSCSKKRRRR